MEHDSLLNEQLRKKTKENLFDFIEYNERQKRDNERDLGLFLEVPEEENFINNQTPVNTLIKDMEKLKKGIFTNGYFSLGDKREMDTNRFFKDSIELAKFMEQILDKCDDHPSIIYTGTFYTFF